MLRSTSGDRERADEADRVRLRHLAGDDAGHVGDLVELRVVDAHVGRQLVAGRVLELHVGELGGDLEHRLHVAKRGREDDLVALRGEVADDALGIGAFGHLLDDRRLHLVAELALDLLLSEVVREGPAGVACRPDVDPGGLERLGGRGGGHRCRRGCRGRCRVGDRRGRRLVLLAAGHEGRCADGSQSGDLQQRTFLVVEHVLSSVERYLSHEPGWNGRPSEAGMLMRIQVGLREMRASTTIVET